LYVPMKNEPLIDKEEVVGQEEKDLIRFLKKKGYDQIFRLNRAYAVLEYVKNYKVHDYEHDALKVILLQDPSMAEVSPEFAWENRHEVYITGWKFGLDNIVMALHDSYKKTIIERVLSGGSEADWRKRVEDWPLSPSINVLGLDPNSEERKYWLQRFGQLEEKFRQFLKDYDNTVEEAKKVKAGENVHRTDRK